MTSEGAWGGDVGNPVNLLTAAVETTNAKLTLFTVDNNLVAGETYYFRIQTDPESDWSGENAE